MIGAIVVRDRGRIRTVGVTISVGRTVARKNNVYLGYLKEAQKARRLCSAHRGLIVAASTASGASMQLISLVNCCFVGETKLYIPRV